MERKSWSHRAPGKLRRKVKPGIALLPKSAGKLLQNRRIDRVDVAKDREKVYVKVIDYKSGNKKFDLAALYYGLQLQLVVYM